MKTEVGSGDTYIEFECWDLGVKLQTEAGKLTEDLHAWIWDFSFEIKVKK